MKTNRFLSDCPDIYDDEDDHNVTVNVHNHLPKSMNPIEEMIQGFICGIGILLLGFAAIAFVIWIFGG